MRNSLFNGEDSGAAWVSRYRSVKPFWILPQTELLSFSMSPVLTAIFPGGLWLAGTRMSPFLILSELRMMEVVSGDNWSYKTFKAAVKSSPPTIQHPVSSYKPDARTVAQPAVSEHRRKKVLSLAVVKVVVNRDFCKCVTQNF